MRATAWGLTNYAGEILFGSRAKSELGCAQMRARDITAVLPPRLLNILDLANGRLRPQYTILQAQGHCVYGIDQINGVQSSLADLSYAFARALFRYQIHFPNRNKRHALVRGTVDELPFGDATFDLVTSVAAFEHFLNVPRVLNEVHRVLRPGGVVWTCIHLFTSPSGGHNLGFNEIPLRHLPRGVAPWDHLRERKLPFSVPLNEWRRDQYREEFAERFSIVQEYCLTREGENLLTPELEHELAMYDRDELTCGAYVIVAHKDA